eukprot:gene8150-5681_t
MWVSESVCVVLVQSDTPCLYLDDPPKDRYGRKTIILFRSVFKHIYQNKKKREAGLHAVARTVGLLVSWISSSRRGCRVDWMELPTPTLPLPRQ